MVKVWKTCPMASLKIGWAKYGQFSKTCLKIGPFSNRCLKIRSIFKQILVNRCQWDEVDLGWGACPLSPVVGVVKEFCEALGHVMHVNHLWALQTHVVSCGNLRPLLNGESLKNWPNGEFEKRMSKIWSIFKQMFEIWSIFKQMLENTVHFKTNFEKYPLASPPPYWCRNCPRMTLHWSLEWSTRARLALAS